jgi:hypothetical protein
MPKCASRAKPVEVRSSEGFGRIFWFKARAPFCEARGPGGDVLGPHRLRTTCAPAAADQCPLRDGAAVVDSHAARWAYSIREPRRMRARPSAVAPPVHCQQPALVILQRSFEISRVVRLPPRTKGRRMTRVVQGLARWSEAR